MVLTKISLEKRKWKLAWLNCTLKKTRCQASKSYGYIHEENRIENIKKSGRISWKTLEDQLSGKTQNQYNFSCT